MVFIKLRYLYIFKFESMINLLIIFTYKKKIDKQAKIWDKDIDATIFY